MRFTEQEIVIRRGRIERAANHQTGLGPLMRPVNVRDPDLDGAVLRQRRMGVMERVAGIPDVSARSMNGETVAVVRGVSRRTWTSNIHPRPAEGERWRQRQRSDGQEL